MIRQTKAVTAVATLLCLGLTLVVIESFSTMKFMSRRPNWKRLANHRQCPASRSYNDKGSRSRLFAASDFSSHPYSVYYGTSGSTAQQNFGQNDDINDVYGYAPDAGERDEHFDGHQHNPNRNLQSMQDIPLFDGRRGATVFSRKYNDQRPQFYQDPHIADEREMMLHEDRMMEDGHMMDHVDSLMHERDHLRSQLDAVVSENIHLHNQNNVNGVGPQVMPPQGQNQCFPGANCMPHDGPQFLPQENPSTRSAVDSVMDELKHMRRTVQAFETQHYQRNSNGGENSFHSHTMNPATAPSVESIKSELNDMEQVLHNFEQEKAAPSGFANGYDAPTGEVSKSEYTNLNGSASPVSEQRQPGAESMSQVNGSAKPDHAAQLFDGQYEVVIKAELKKKHTHSVEKQIDVNKDSARESPTVAGGTFGSNYI